MVTALRRIQDYRGFVCTGQGRVKCKEVKVYVCATFKGKNETMTVCVGSVYEKERWSSVGSSS